MVVAASQVAQSPDITRDDVLKLIPPHYIQSIFKRPHLERELIIGLVGQRGGGKSGSSATIGLVDYMLEGVPLFSNMSIACDMVISTDQAQNLGLNRGGEVHYQSLPLEKQALLKLDDKYRHCCLLIEEINVQYSNTRRAMSNTNIDFNIVVQELRHLEASLIYNVIDEMFIDVQLRGLTDIFIKTEDTAFTLENLRMKKQPGIDFKWNVYPMSGYLCGHEGSYYNTQRPMDPMYLHFFPFRGIYDDKIFQRKGKYSMNLQEQMKAQLVVESDAELVEEVNQWLWLEEKVRALRNSKKRTITAQRLWSILDPSGHGLVYNSPVFQAKLNSFGIFKTMHKEHGERVYAIEKAYQVERDGLTECARVT